ncbi:MAG: acetylxylan esterase [Planctomycetes bacterium]|nr:acetylxylan esterase [Planctomycetota bacterium]
MGPHLMHYSAQQQARRQQLWGVLGDLPKHRIPTARIVHIERREDYRLEYLELDLNGIEAVPAIMLIPDGLRGPAPAMQYIHWHGGNYGRGKEELFEGRPVLKPYAPVYAERGLVALAIDSWCFGGRMPYPNDGPRGEADTFKEMLWKGRCLWGMMIFDEWQALNYLCSRPEVDQDRIGVFGISMGSTKAWWLAALDERVQCCIDLCCLTDYEALIAAKGLSGHGLYYYVPGLLKHFQSHEINELIVPRPRLSLNGSRDLLTPPAGVERIRNHLYDLYTRLGREEHCRIELFDCGHEETPEMRALVIEWIDRYLVSGPK